MFFSHTDDETDSDTEDEITIKTIGSKIDDLTTCNNLVNSHGGSLQKAISDHVDRDPNKAAQSTLDKHSQDPVAQNLRLINEKAQLFRITSNAMINVSLTLQV